MYYCTIKVNLICRMKFSSHSVTEIINYKLLITHISIFIDNINNINIHMLSLFYTFLYY